MSKEIPDSYKEQDGCCNCDYVFVKLEWDDERRYHCMFNAVHPRPPCGSVYMKECHDRMFFDKDIIYLDELPEDYRTGFDIISEYYKPKEVEPWGVCNEYKRKGQNGFED